MENFDWNILAVSSEPVDNTISETKAPSDSNQPGGTKPPGANPFQMMMLVVLFVVMFIILFRGPRKQQQKQKKMLQALKKNDRVQTVGGIYGTIVDISEKDITLKVDESNNTKIRISPNAIGKNLSNEDDKGQH